MINKLLVLGVMVLFGSELFAQAVTIRGVRLQGTGCGPATASVSVTPDGQTMSVLFDNYAAEVGVGSKNPGSTVDRKNCNVLIDVDVPAGYQYALTQTDYRGFAALPSSAYGMHRFTQIVPGQQIPSMREAQIRGPLANNYEVVVRSKPGRVPYSVCNQRQQTINLLSELMVAFLPNTSDRSMATINLDSVDTGVASSFILSWRQCR